ncbi:MAG TPA: glycoside hydrolase family 38 C-terminal domain-containing protein, partial [Phycisphaerae bacterium]|nr:glycoside hydrolase family 38 C-terminal domain-containing protein [Phycisphaerae bacterium]
VWFIKTCIEPARFNPLCELDVEVFQCPEPCSFDEAMGAQYKPVSVGFQWGPAWSTAWFRMTGAVPPDVAVDRLYAFIDTGSEACIWKDGTPYHGLSEYHKCAPLDASFIENGRLTLMVEAAANRLWGLDGWEQLRSDEPIGRLTQARAALIVPEVNRLYHDVTFALQLADALDKDSPRRRKLIFALNEAVNAVDPARVPDTAPPALERLKPALAARANASAAACHAVGHAHIDMAWLWPIRETRRKCYRTFSTVLRNMERFGEYRFQQGQAQLYAFIKEDHPELFEAIRRRVADGRWDAGGGLWVEPDCNLIGGESLVRQILHAASYWRTEFGVEQTYLWLPDTFGYCAALPQILAQAGMPTFFTQKLSWNQFNRFPHHTFWWVGLDGTRVLAHFLTSDTYSSDCSPAQLRTSERAFRQSDRCNHWLYAFGWGDGGGGPTADMLELLQRSKDCEELPRVRMSTVAEFADALHRDARNLPSWDGELYLETHRGTLTTHAANKRHNRRAELRLRDAEMLHALSPHGLGDYPADALDECWKILLLNQFHDILPGSSIRWVYEDSERDYARLAAKLDEIVSTGLRHWAEAADTSATANPIVAVNTLSWPRTEVVELPADVASDHACVTAPDEDDATPIQQGVALDGGATRLALLADVNPIGHRVFDVVKAAAPADSVTPASASSRSLENEWLRVELDDAGRLVSLLDKHAGRDVLRDSRPANQFVLYEDRPHREDAWNVEIHYLEKRHPVDAPADITVAENGPLRASLRI